MWEGRRPLFRPPLMAAFASRPRSVMRAPTAMDGGFWHPLAPSAGGTDTTNDALVAGSSVAAVRERHTAVGNATAAKRPRKEEAARLRSMVVLSEIATEYLQAAPAVLRITERDGTVLPETPSFVAMLTRKSTGTLSKRASSLRMYRAWFRATGAAPVFFLTEEKIFNYFHSLYVDGAPATRAAALREAVNFLQGVFEVDVSNIRSSSRVLGMAVQLLRSETETKQRSSCSAGDGRRQAEDVDTGSGGSGLA